MSVASTEKDLTNLGCYRYPSHFIPLKPPNESDHCFNHISYLAGLTHTIGTPDQHKQLDTSQPIETALGKFAARLVSLEITTVLAQKEKEKLFHPKYLSSRPWLKWHIACAAAEPTLLASIKGTVVNNANLPSPIIITDGGEDVAVIKSAGNPLVFGLASREEFGIFPGCFGIPNGIGTDLDPKQVERAGAHELPLRDLGGTALIRLSTFLTPPEDRQQYSQSTTKIATTVSSISRQITQLPRTPLSDEHYDIMTSTEDSPHDYHQ